MIHPEPRILRMGDRSLLIELGSGITPELNDRVRSASLLFSREPLEGLLDIVPTYHSVLLLFDPLKVEAPQVEAWALRRLKEQGTQPLPEAKTHEVPVVYGGEYGPDLEWVAQYHGITPEEVVRLHTGCTYRIYMIGFTPGFAYMGKLPEALQTPRKETPRTRVPRGSVAIAQWQTGIYPSVSPGGWQILGWTPLRLFDPLSRPPTPFEPGDHVRFVSIREEELKAWAS